MRSARCGTLASRALNQPTMRQKSPVVVCADLGPVCSDCKRVGYGQGGIRSTVRCGPCLCSLLVVRAVRLRMLWRSSGVRGESGFLLGCLAQSPDSCQVHRAQDTARQAPCWCAPSGYTTRCLDRMNTHSTCVSNAASVADNDMFADAEFSKVAATLEAPTMTRGLGKLSPKSTDTSTPGLGTAVEDQNPFVPDKAERRGLARGQWDPALSGAVQGEAAKKSYLEGMYYCIGSLPWNGLQTDKIYSTYVMGTRVAYWKGAATLCFTQPCSCSRKVLSLYAHENALLQCRLSGAVHAGYRSQST